MNMFAVRLKAMRKERKETQEDIAKLLKIQRTTVGEYERGNIRPPMDKMKVLADHFGTSVDYLMGNTNLEKSDTEFSSEDIAFELKKLLDKLQNKNHVLLFEHEEINDEYRDILIGNLQNVLKMGKFSK